MLVFTANPEDYTARGKIITPLKDRIGSEIRTHYPSTRSNAIAITTQEAWTERPGHVKVEIPAYVREVVEEVAFQARADRKIDKRSGVSQRLPITTLELVVSNAERRALANSESMVVPRVTDLYAALPSITGKFELEYEGELRGAEQVARDLIRSAVGNVFTGMFDGVDTRTVVEWFDLGGSLPLSDVSSGRRRDHADAGRAGPARIGRASRRSRGAPRRRPSPRPSISCSKGSTRRRRSAAARSAATPPAPSPRRAVRRGVKRRRWTKRFGFRARRRSTDNYGHMKYRYTKFTGELLDELDLEDLVAKLSDLLLSSGFGNPYATGENDRTMQALHDAILEALFNGGVLPEETIEKLLGDPADGDQSDTRSQLEELIQQIIERMGEQGYITTPPDLEAERQRRAGRGGNGPEPAAGALRGDRQDARFPRLPRASRSARFARQEQLSAATTRVNRRPASKRPARPSRTSSATR